MHIICTATTTSTPAISLGGTSKIVLAATCPGGATFGTSDVVLAQNQSDLPGGENISYQRPTGTNTQTVAVTGSGLGITAQTVTIQWLLVINR